MENVKVYKDLFVFDLLKINDEGSFVAFKRNNDTFTDVTEAVMNTPIISIGLKSQYLYMENDAFKVSPIKQQFTPLEKEKYKAKGGKNVRYRMVYLPERKRTYIFTYKNGIAESFYLANIGVTDAFRIIKIEKRATVHAKSTKMGVKFFAPVLEKVNIRDIQLDDQDKATLQELKTYFEPYKPVEVKAIKNEVEADDIPF